MSSPNSDPVPNPELTSSSGFNTQSQMGLPEILQMCCLSRRSGQITFRSGESYGYVYIQHGRVLHAMCGVTEGEEAIYRMLTWPGGGFTLDEDILPHKKTVTLTWEQLLFEGARRADEGESGPKTGAPVTTITSPSTIRTQESQPKLTVMRPDLPPVTCELDREYTHAGRASGNEIPLPYPSVSTRHCIFIMSGPDIVLRDLNSSNGTYVNGEAIDETVLRPGDLIQVGTVQMKFEPGIKRPKLVSPIPSEQESFGALKTTASSSGALYHATVKLPNRPVRNPQEGQAMDDSAYVKGESAINYSDLAKPEVEKKKSAWIFLIGLLVLILAAGACYYFFFMHGTAKAN